jgi:hypothetical protein
MPASEGGRYKKNPHKRKKRPSVFAAPVCARRPAWQALKECVGYLGWTFGGTSGLTGAGAGAGEVGAVAAPGVVAEGAADSAAMG